MFSASTLRGQALNLIAATFSSGPGFLRDTSRRDATLTGGPRLYDRKHAALNRKCRIIAPLLVLFLGIAGFNLFSGNAEDSEMVFTATEVGTPEGAPVSKEIGPAGGTLASPDGRLTLTVPLNALTETIAFSIQPIMNKAENGLGLAYRLEPDGKTFTPPLEISIRYDEKNLEGTVLEALSIVDQ